ncbi:MAG: hypothetical protein ABII82_04365 [Verrucomicrobiota bacterium]
MTIAIIGTFQSGVRGTLTGSLCRLLESLGVPHRVLDLDRLMNQPETSRFRLAKQRLLAWKLRHLADYDLIIVISTIPHAFRKDFAVEALRQHAPQAPVVLAANLYLPSRPHFIAALRDEGHHGLGRYDHYLCTSVHNVHPVPRGPQPATLIGLRLDGRLLHPGPARPLSALLDFERPGGEERRAEEVRALKEAGIPHEQLGGTLSYPDLCARYRQSGLFFLSFGESFGVPLCEAQACGSYIVTPSANWCQAHQIKQDIHLPGPGRLNENFIVYDDIDDLKHKLSTLDRRHDPLRVRRRVEADFPHYLQGDPDALATFLERCRAGDIHADSHRAFPFDGIFPET